MRKPLDPNFDVIVFENLRFRPSTRTRQISVFKNLQSGERFSKISVLVALKRRLRVDGRCKRRKRIDGALDFTLVTSTRIAELNFPKHRHPRLKTQQENGTTADR